MKALISSSLALCTVMFSFNIYAATQNTQEIHKIELMAAVQYNNSQDLSDMLKKYPSYAQATTTNGGTLLHSASKRGFDAVVEILLQYKTPIDTQDNRGNTALHYAYRALSSRTVALLLHAGANQNIKNYEQKEPFNMIPPMGLKAAYAFCSKVQELKKQLIKQKHQ